MGARSGGGGGAGMGSGSRGTTNLFKGGWDENSGPTSEIWINGINKQTEKAMNVNVGVSWGNGGNHNKDIWVPKSTIGHIDKDSSGKIVMTMKKSMAQSIANQNTFKGYAMDFTTSYNVW